MLLIKDIKVSIQENVILDRISLQISPGETHLLIGPNGAGKSTLAHLLAGDPTLKVERGKVEFQGIDLLTLEPEERSKRGLFVSFQNPPETGVDAHNFLRTAINVRRKVPLKEDEFENLLTIELEKLGLNPLLYKRPLHRAFSGGEKKRSELLQMSLLQPTIAILDEPDSGLDIDALKEMEKLLTARQRANQGSLLITHYSLSTLVPDRVHVLIGGKVVASGDQDLVKQIQTHGYESL